MLKLNISGGRVLEQLKLPVPLDEFKRKVDEIRAAGQPNIAPTVLNADSSVPALNWHLQQTRLDSDSTLQKLSQLAETIDGMNAAEHYHLSKSLDPESQQSLDDVLRIAAHIKPASLACYEVIPGVTSHQELGRWLVEHDRLEDKVPETLRPYLDYRSIGIDYCNSHEGEFLADSYTGIQSGAMEQVLEEQGVLHLTLSTAKGTFPLEEIVRIKNNSVYVPGPHPWAWQPAGRILLGSDFSLAWRVFDAQYWPRTPQRRRRIFLIADFAGRSAPQILFEQNRLPGYPAQGEGTWEGAAAPAESGADGTGGADSTGSSGI